MTGHWRLVPLAAEHTRGLAECHIACWREAYRGLVPEHVLDAFDVDERARAWEQGRTRPGTTVLALAPEPDGPTESVIGFARAAPAHFTRLPGDENPATLEIQAMYVRAGWYGTGVAHDLMRAILLPDVDTALWVFEENPRARAFYAKYGFAPDGTRQLEPFTLVPEIRMMRRKG